MTPPRAFLVLLCCALGACGEAPPPPAPQAQPAPPQAEPAPPSAAARDALARGRALFQAEQPLAAVEELRTAVALAPQWFEARLTFGKLLLTLSWVSLGTATYDRTRLAQASSELEQARALDPLSAEAAYWAGKAQVADNRQAEARARFEAALALDPRHGLAWKELGLSLVTEGENARAKECLQRARELLPRDDEVPFQLGLLLAAEDDLLGARTALLESVALNPAHPGPRVKLIAVHQRLGDAEAAARASAELTRVKEFSERLSAATRRAQETSRDPEALLAVARLYLELDMRAAARPWLERTLRVEPGQAEAAALLAELAGAETTPPTR